MDVAVGAPVASPLAGASPTARETVGAQGVEDAAASPAAPTLTAVPASVDVEACQVIEPYIVADGDTLSGVADRYGVSVARLLDLNPQVTDPDVILVGEEIAVPTMTDLGTLGGPESRVGAINDRGQIVGTADLPTPNVYHAFLVERGVMNDLGTLGGSVSQGVDINDRGQVAGVSTASPEASAPWRAVVWDHGTVTDLGTLGGAMSMAHAINGRGDVVGISAAANGNGRGFIWRDGVMTDLGTLGGTVATVPIGINDRAQVVGSAFTEAGDQHAFLWQNGTMTDLGTLGGTWSEAHDINAQGQVVGVSSLAGGYEGGLLHAFLWEGGTMTDLGTLGGPTSMAVAISDRGQIVGNSTTADGVRHAFSWADGTMSDIGVPGGREAQATDVNDRGQVVGTCQLTFGSHAFVRDPRPPLPVVRLIAPAPNAVIVQNDPSTGCALDPTRGYGNAGRFEWSAPAADGVSAYRLVLARLGASYPVLDVRTTATSYTWTSCHSFVIDANLGEWRWQVTALGVGGQPVAVSKWRALSFAPCRLAGGSACYAPG